MMYCIFTTKVSVLWYLLRVAVSFYGESKKGIDLQNSFTAAKITKFPTKPILGYPLHPKYVAALPWKTQKQKFCTFHACKTCFKCDFLSSIQQLSVKCHKNKCKD